MDFTEAIDGLLTIDSTMLMEAVDQQASLIGFMGFSGCPYCQKFAPKFKAAVAGQKAYFIPSREASDAVGIAAFRQAYNIPTVPALIVIKEGKVSVVCDSSLTVEAIKEFAGMNNGNPR